MSNFEDEKFFVTNKNNPARSQRALVALWRISCPILCFGAPGFVHFKLLLAFGQKQIAKSQMPEV